MLHNGVALDKFYLSLSLFLVRTLIVPTDPEDMQNFHPNPWSHFFSCLVVVYQAFGGFRGLPIFDDVSTLQHLVCKIVLLFLLDCKILILAKGGNYIMRQVTATLIQSHQWNERVESQDTPTPSAFSMACRSVTPV